MEASVFALLDSKLANINHKHDVLYCLHVESVSAGQICNGYTWGVFELWTFALKCIVLSSGNKSQRYQRAMKVEYSMHNSFIDIYKAAHRWSCTDQGWRVSPHCSFPFFLSVASQCQWKQLRATSVVTFVVGFVIFVCEKVHGN